MVIIKDNFSKIIKIVITNNLSELKQLLADTPKDKVEQVQEKFLDTCFAFNAWLILTQSVEFFTPNTQYLQEKSLPFLTNPDKNTELLSLYDAQNCSFDALLLQACTSCNLAMVGFLLEKYNAKLTPQGINAAIKINVLKTFSDGKSILLALLERDYLETDIIVQLYNNALQDYFSCSYLVKNLDSELIIKILTKHYDKLPKHTLEKLLMRAFSQEDDSLIVQLLNLPASQTIFSTNLNIIRLYKNYFSNQEFFLKINDYRCNFPHHQDRKRNLDNIDKTILQKTLSACFITELQALKNKLADDNSKNAHSKTSFLSKIHNFATTSFTFKEKVVALDALISVLAEREERTILTDYTTVLLSGELGTLVKSYWSSEKSLAGLFSRLGFSPNKAPQDTPAQKGARGLIN